MKNSYKHIYWFIPFVLWFLQIIYFRASLFQFRLEEFFDVRSVYWFQHRLVFNGGYANVGWYAPITILYNIFGFSFAIGKIYRSVLYFVSILCLWSVLKKYLGEKRAVVPILVIGLSPTLLFYSTIQVPWGSDLQFLPICIFIAVSSARWLKFFFLREVLLGFISMLAWLAYPTFFYFLPFIFGLWFFYHRFKFRKLGKNFMVLFISFLIPLVLTLLWVQNKQILIRDPNLYRGLFTGNGSFEMNPSVWGGNLKLMFGDLFVSAKSYYFEAAKVEFSDIYPVLGLAAAFGVCLMQISKRLRLRKLAIILCLALLASLTLTNLTGPATLGGIRRNTPVLVAIYALFAYVWFLVSSKKKRLVWDNIVGASLILILLHHIIVFPVNLAKIKLQSNFAEKVWFTDQGSVQATLANYLGQVTKRDIILSCVDSQNRQVYCEQLSVPFSTIKSACLWNHLSCHDILGYDPQVNDVVKLDVNFFPNRIEP